MVWDAEALALAGHEAFDMDTFLQCHFCFFRVQRQRLIIFRRQNSCKPICYSFSSETAFGVCDLTEFRGFHRATRTTPRSAPDVCADDACLALPSLYLNKVGIELRYKLAIARPRGISRPLHKYPSKNCGPRLNRRVYVKIVQKYAILWNN